MKVIIDNGHGKETLGKRSPVWDDGSQLLEWRYAREIAVMLEQELVRRGVDVVRIVPEDTDVSLRERCNRVNKLCVQFGAKNCLLVSIHCNAAGNAGKPMQARGWSVFVGLNASQNSKSLATLFSASAEAQGLKVRVSSPNQRYWVQNLAMCRDTSSAN